MAKAARKDVAFKSLTEPLLNGNIVLDSDWLDTKSVMVYVTLIIACCAIFACIFLFCKIKKLATALVVLQRVVNVNSDQLPSFIYENVDKQLEVEDSINNTFLSEFQWIHGFSALAVLIFIIIIISFVIIFYSRKKMRNNSLS